MKMEDWNGPVFAAEHPIYFMLFRHTDAAGSITFIPLLRLAAWLEHPWQFLKWELHECYNHESN